MPTDSASSTKGGMEAFTNGLVFGFDVGTGSIGYAVRRGKEFLNVGVIICPEDVGDLKTRRGLRRQRRTLRSKKYRRQWLARELERLGFPKPKPDAIHDPVSLRVRAVKGDKLLPEELHAAIAHLWKRRGCLENVPWSSHEEGDNRKKEEGVIKEKMSALREEMKREACEFPCQLLAKRRATHKPQRKEFWPRDLLEEEFRAIVRAQAVNFSKLADKANWLLYGDDKKVVKGEHVFFKSTEGRKPGVLGLRWPRFDNRGPALDAWQPVDEKGRPLHVVRKNKEAFKNAQWELAVLNFRVIDMATGALVMPAPDALARLREMWESSRRKPRKTKKTDAGAAQAESAGSHETPAVKVSESLLKKWSAEFSARYRLVEHQPPLTPQTGAGRARFASPTLRRLREIIADGQRPQTAQPVLRRNGETTEAALNRYLADIGHPLVRHRLVLFRRMLSQLVSRHGKPDMIVLEAIRSLALGKKAKNELNKRNEQFRRERENAREELASSSESVSGNAITRYRLWHEAGGRCPFCLQAIERSELGYSADIEHLVPHSRVDCNEWFNLTVAHIRCNREIKGNRTPFEAFGRTEQWPAIKQNAENRFKGRELERKLRIFLSENAEELIEQKADLQHTAYIARVIRHVVLIQLGWLNEEGRDPTPEKQNAALSFQVTNGQITSRLRQEWGLNRILHPLPSGKRWDDLGDVEKKQFQEKNRGDLRHHALDAMVIACTLPWLAHRTHGATDEFGNHGWWTQDEKMRSKAANPTGLDYEKAKAVIEKVVIRHHVSRSNHKQAYFTTLYAKKAKDTYVAREVFTTLKPKNLAGIYPQDFADYCEVAWKQYSAESPDIESELKKSKGCVPESFTRKLCFSHFQRWKVQGAPEFSWPREVKIPIRGVRLISVKDDNAVMPFSKGTHAYVKRDGFKEVRIHLAEDHKSFVPVFVPYWQGDAAFSHKPIDPDKKPVGVVRRGDIVILKSPLSSGATAGVYRIVSAKQAEVKLVPAHLRDDERTLTASGFNQSGVRPRWQEFIRALGYELPHPPSAQSQSPSAAEA